MSGEKRMNVVEQVEAEITVVIGKACIPIFHLLRMGRGAVIELETPHGDEVEIYANDFLIARGQVIVQGKRVHIEITKLITAK